MPEILQVPQHLRPYRFHGVRLEWGIGEQAVGNCPFCGREGKFSVKVEDGRWRCFVCGAGNSNGGGNVYTFLRLLWERSEVSTNGHASEFAKERGLLSPDTLAAWGVRRSVISGRWMVPGYGPNGELNQLYLRIKTPERYELRPTTTLPHQLHGIPLYDSTKSIVYLHESWGNALAFWEVARTAKIADGKLVQTGAEAASLLADANVLAVANCGAVGEPLKKFLPLLADKTVVLMFDSDHPRSYNGQPAESAGHGATRRLCQILALGTHPPREIRYLHWGDKGYDPERSSGYDVRDHISFADNVPGRVERLNQLLEKVQPMPDNWVNGKPSGKSKDAKNGVPEVETIPCDNWKALLNQWRLAMRMRQGLEDVLSVMLAVALSTDQIGDQVFLQVIGEAGSGKTRFCDAMLISKYCFPLEHLTGFHSGWKDDNEEDYSLLGRINHKTLITPEGDVLMSSPRFTEIMSQQRRIFDGTSGASYKNRKEDMRYTGLRTPWIIAGTPALMDTDQSRLGDRFLRVFVDNPDLAERRGILRRVGYTALRSVKVASNCKSDAQLDEDMLKAYRMTGGYVDWLRKNSTELLNSVEVDPDDLVDYCADLGEYVADLRARPNPDVKKDLEPSKELPSRLTHQFVRLSCCLAVVLGKMKVETDVLRVSRKVSVDTSSGIIMRIVNVLRELGEEGDIMPGIAVRAKEPEERVKRMLQFMHTLDMVKCFSVQAVKGIRNPPKWRLSPRLLTLHDQVHYASNPE